MSGDNLILSKQAHRCIFFINLGPVITPACMTKKAVLLLLLLIVLAVCFIPVTRQKTFLVKASFFNVYQQLAKPRNWGQWRSDLRSLWLSDSAKISNTMRPDGFKINAGDLNLNVQIQGYVFAIAAHDKNDKHNYAYTVLPGKFSNATLITVTKTIGLFNYMLTRYNNSLFSDTHVNDLKNFMENDDLYYGYKIIKKRVTDTNIIVLRKLVLSKDKFAEAAKSLTALKQYFSVRHLTQTQPLIAQFFDKHNDSTQVNIGLPVDKKVPAKNPVTFMEMPSTGYFYTVRFRGKFKDRLKAYAAVHRYFNDRLMPIPILPLETYLDNKLPISDSDTVNIQINFPTF